MTKKIPLHNIQPMISRRNPYEVIQAVSRDNAIGMYFNPTQLVLVTRVCPYLYKYSFQEITANSSVKPRINIREIEEQHLKTEKSNEKFYAILFTFFSFYLTLVFSNILHIYTLCFITSSICTFAIMLAFTVFRTSASETKRCSAFLRSNHAAEHMIINFLKKKRRLPCNVDELMKASQIDKYCDTKEKVISSTIDTTITFILVSIVNIFISCILTTFHFSNTLIYVCCSCFFLIAYIICIMKKLYSKKLNSLFSTMISCMAQHIILSKKNISKESLLMAYIAAANWFSITHEDQFDLEAYNRFFAGEKIRVYYDECEKPDQS